MTNHLHDNELYSLVRRALPEIDTDTLSPTGAQAQAVLDRVIGADRLAELDQHSPDNGPVVMPLPRLARRRARLIAASVGVAAAAVAATLLVVTLVASPSISPTPATAQPHGVVAVRARLLAALTEASNDVVKVAGQKEVSSSGVTTCPVTRWFFPADAQPGGEFRERVEGACRSITSESAVDITVGTVTPYVLPTTASQAKQSLFPVAEVGESVCGTGSFSGYNKTPNEATSTTWQASEETLRVPAPATPELLRFLVKAGSLRLVGNTTVDGAAAIELSVLVPTGSQSSFTITEKLWVDPSTYLPIREVMSYEPKPMPANAPPGAFPTTSGESAQNFTFLPPTPANLALLKVSIPRGLTQASAPTALTTHSCSAVFAGGPRHRG